MNILVTGAGGFIGRRLALEIISQDRLMVNGASIPVDQIYLADMALDNVEDIIAANPKVHPLCGDISDPALLEQISKIAPTVIIHLAAVVSSAAEQDFDLGMRVNVDALRGLIGCCRDLPVAPVFVFSSSLAVFSCEDNGTLAEDTVPTPRSSYGVQKVIGELLVQDASRKKFLHGRSIRFPTIAVRPGAPNKAASSFVSSIIREPLAGKEAVLPVSPELKLYLASPDDIVGAVMRAVGIEQERLGGQTTVTLPGLSVTVKEMLESLEGVSSSEAVSRIRHVPDPQVRSIVGTWPGDVKTPRAQSLGFSQDDHLDDMIRKHIEETS